jgi:hypothetical protein
MRRAVAALLLAGFAGGAHAHARGSSYSEWTLAPGGGEVRARISALDLTRARLHPQHTPGYAAAAGDLLAARLQLYSGGERCSPGTVEARVGADGWLRARWPVQCRASGAPAIRSVLPAVIAPGHLHFVRARLPSGELRERVLTAGDAVLELPPVEPPTLGRYVLLGVEHILSGWDHLAFVLALLLLASSLREMVLVATGFTLAHSLTLGAAVLGLVQVRAGLVEALIGFSIAMAAVEGLWRRARAAWMPLALAALLAASALRAPSALAAGMILFTLCYFALLPRLSPPGRLRIAMSLLFGLVHGFGFAGALAELELPAERLAGALFGFNVGVELGQLLVVALAWPLLRWLARRPALDRPARDAVASGLCALGVYWFLVRSLA